MIFRIAPSESPGKPVAPFLAGTSHPDPSFAALFESQSMSLRSSTLFSLVILLAPFSTFAQQSDPATGLAITEVMWKSGHPESNDGTGLGGNAQGDWYELTNFGTAAIDLGGYLMDDSDELFGNDYAILPSIMLQPNETIVVVQENDAYRSDGFQSAWGLPDGLRILGECTSTGGDTFSGISSNGESLYIYPPNAVNETGDPAIVNGELVPAILSVALPPATNAGGGPGMTLSWDADGNALGLSSENGTLLSGAYEALHDGSETAGPFPVLDIASPGFVQGLDVAPSVAGVQPTLTRLFTNEPQFTCDPEPFECDADGDGDCDLLDLDALYAANGTEGANGVMGLLDLDASGTVDADDINGWLAEASDSDNPSKINPADVLKPGDTNLDGKVNSIDLGELLSNFNATADVTYGDGELNLDGLVNSLDLGLLLSEFGFDSASPAASAAAVPEPASATMLTFAMLGLAGFAGIGRRAARRS